MHQLPTLPYLAQLLTKISQDDGRQRRYQLTAEGRYVIEQLRDDRRHAIRAIWSDLPGPAVTRFARFAGELGDRLERFADQPTRKDP